MTAEETRAHDIESHTREFHCPNQYGNAGDVSSAE
jgi:hypothetical protein